jgi:hypothetical protein
MKPTAPWRNNFSELVTTPAVAYLFLVRPMAHSSRRRLEIEGRVAFLILVASMFPNMFAQRHEGVWLQAVSTCVTLVCGLTSAPVCVSLRNV